MKTMCENEMNFNECFKTFNQNILWHSNEYNMTRYIARWRDFFQFTLQQKIFQKHDKEKLFYSLIHHAFTFSSFVKHRNIQYLNKWTFHWSFLQSFIAINTIQNDTLLIELDEINSVSIARQTLLFRLTTWFFEYLFKYDKRELIWRWCRFRTK